MESLLFEQLLFTLHPDHYNRENDNVYDYIISEQPFANITTIAEYDKVFYDVYAIKDPDIIKPISCTPFQSDTSINLHLITEDSLNQVINIDDHFPSKTMDKWLFNHFLLIRLECVKYLHLLINKVQACSNTLEKSATVDAALKYISNQVDFLASKPPSIQVISSPNNSSYPKNFLVPSANDSSEFDYVLIPNAFKDSAFNGLMFVFLTKLYYEVILVFKQFVKQYAQNLYKQFSKSGTIGALTLNVIVEKFTIARCVLFIETEEYNVKIIDFLLRELYHHYDTKKRNVELENAIIALENYWFISSFNFKERKSFEKLINLNNYGTLLRKAQIKHSKNVSVGDSLLSDNCFNLIHDNNGEVAVTSLPRSFVKWFYDYNIDRLPLLTAQQPIASTVDKEFFVCKKFNTNFDKINTLRDALVDAGFIEKINLSHFKAVFISQDVSTPIVWMTYASDLSYFIQLLNKKGFLLSKKNRHWHIVPHCFVDSNKKPFIHSDVKGKHKTKANYVSLEKIVTSFSKLCK